MKTAVVTGSDGFIGRHITRELKRRDYYVLELDLKRDAQRVSPWPHNDALNFFREDGTKFDLAFHCAAFVGGRQAIDNSPLMVGTNAALDSWYFEWLLRSKTTRAVYFSSSAAYPRDLQRTPHKLREYDINLDFPDTPDATYGWVKLYGEVLAHYAEQAGSRVHVFRPFSGYGEDQDLDYPFPSFIKRARDREDPFVIWGDGKQVRDWIHVDDIVAAVFKAIELDIEGPVNLGTGKPTDFTTLAQLVCQEAGYVTNLDYKIDAPQGVSYRCSDNSKLLTFYEPKILLADGIRRALEVTA
jgi:nucleoside-diphosphate-sugar epimerase